MSWNSRRLYGVAGVSVLLGVGVILLRRAVSPGEPSALADVAWWPAAVLVLLAASWSFVGFWSWQRIARRLEARLVGGSSAYRVALGSGLYMCLFMAVVRSVKAWHGSPIEAVLTFPFVGYLLSEMWFGLPIWLWGGYFFAKTLARTLPPPNQALQLTASRSDGTVR